MTWTRSTNANGDPINEWTHPTSGRVVQCATGNSPGGMTWVRNFQGSVTSSGVATDLPRGFVLWVDRPGQAGACYSATSVIDAAQSLMDDIDALLGP